MTKTLREWESIIKPQFKRVRLLGEIPLSQADVDEIASLLRDVIARKGSPAATRLFVEKYPCTFATFLAAFAAHNTNREFWDALGRLVQVNGSELNNRNWRGEFISILQAFHKTTFEDVGGVTNKYVTSMRIHGGIPAYSLHDFFENMLMPATRKHEYLELSGTELRDALLKRSTVQLFTDSTVRNFFENSGQIGIDFLRDCREMALCYSAEGRVPSGLNLPLYVCAALVDYLEEPTLDGHVRLRRPRLMFDPEGDGLLLELPEQPIHGAEIGEAFWIIATVGPDSTRHEDVQIRRLGHNIVTEQRTIRLGAPAAAIHVSFHVTSDAIEAVKHRWILQLQPDAGRPLLAFRTQDFSLLRWSQALPAQILLLVYPKDVTLRPEGDARLVHMPSLNAPGWQAWKAEVWSLEAAWVLSLLKDGNEIAVIPIQGQIEEPTLVGPHPFAPNIDAKPLYLGAAPTLRIPLRGHYVLGDELNRWRVELNSHWEASPQIRQEFTLAQKQEIVTQPGDALELNLESLLGAEAVGTYTLRVTNRLDVELDFHFRLWDSLTISQLPEIVLPPPGTVKDPNSALLTFQLALPPQAWCEPRAGAYGVTVSGQAGRYNINVDEQSTRADLDLVIQRPNDQIVRVPLSIPIPRLVWRLALGNEPTIEWTTLPLRRSLDAFLQASQTVPVALIIHMPGLQQLSHQIEVQLVDPEFAMTPIQSFLSERSPMGEDYQRFVLNAYDTLNYHSEQDLFEFQLNIPSSVNTQAVHLPLLTLPRAIEVGHVLLEPGVDYTILIWDEPRPIRNRRVFIRSLWQPWNQGFEISIPDMAHGRYVMPGIGLPASRYEVYFFTAPSWEPQHRDRPEATPHIVEMISPEEQLRWLSDYGEKHASQSFRVHFELACVYETLDRTLQRDQEVQACYLDLEQANLSFLLAFHNWLKVYSEPTQRAVRMKMYRPDRLRRLFADYKPGSEFRRVYLGFISQTSIGPDSAVLIAENEEDPASVIISLRALMARSDPRGVVWIAKLVQSGRLALTDAADLLNVEADFSVTQLNQGASMPAQLRLVSALIQRSKNPQTKIASLASDQIVRLAKAETDPSAVKILLGALIVRQDIRGLEIALDLLSAGLLSESELIEILGENASWSMQALYFTNGTPLPLAQITALARKFPLQTGHIVPNMFIDTPTGWARIATIEDTTGKRLEIIRDNDVQVILRLELQHDPNIVRAMLDRRTGILTLLGAPKFFQCGSCHFVATDQQTILSGHTRQTHGGMGASVHLISSHLPMDGDLRFSMTGQ